QNSSYAFFFQAEDGIRDFHVTGVQTCALPISPRPAPAGLLGRGGDRGLDRAAQRHARRRCPRHPRTLVLPDLHPAGPARSDRVEIGRASCRVRVCASVSKSVIIIIYNTGSLSL